MCPKWTYLNFQSVRESGPHYSEMSEKHWKTITPFGRVITPFRWVITPFQNCVADPKNNKSIWNPPMGVHGASFPSEILKILKKWCPSQAAVFTADGKGKTICHRSYSALLKACVSSSPELAILNLQMAVSCKDSNIPTALLRHGRNRPS